VPPRGEFSAEPPSASRVVSVTFTGPRGSPSAASRAELTSATPEIAHRRGDFAAGAKLSVARASHSDFVGNSSPH
jgi:hypothetical protein